jgi:hypothetical protein
MRRFALALIAAAAPAVLAALIAGYGIGHAQEPKAQVRAADRPPVPYTPGLGDFMSILIQPRHAKIGAAGHEENWALAGYAVKEIKQSFTRIAAVVPKWQGADLAEMIEAAMGQPTTVLDFAIKAGEPRQFGEAYQRFTAACNGCHAMTGSPFIVIKTTQASGFPNQDFKPK